MVDSLINRNPHSSYTNMKSKQGILFLLIFFATNIYSQERIVAENKCFGERVIQDYLSRYGSPQEEHRSPNMWFEDSDTRQMAANFLNSYADSINTDTIFFIHESWAWGCSMKILPGDTLFYLNYIWRNGDFPTFEAFRTPFLNIFDKTYWEDLCTWDTAHISKPSDEITLGGTYHYVARLIYHNGLMQSAETCRHEDKYKYFGKWFSPEKLDTLPYPKDKQWPNMW